MGLKFDWKQVLSLLKPLLMWALEKAYDIAEEWAKGLFDSSGQKPTGADKMVMASNVLMAMNPEIEPAEARALLEMQHLTKTKVV